MAQCLTPLSVKVEQKFGHKAEKGVFGTVPVPCGKCPNCLARRVSGWSFRLMNEDRYAETAYFLTLTYSTTHVPITKNGYMTVRKRDVQLFLKRLRKAHDQYYRSIYLHPTRAPKIKYYAAAEYGTQRKRPHYHLIIFNVLEELVSPAWNKGDVYFGTVAEASVGYTLKYICKDPTEKKHQRDDRAREFALMSKGLGIRYLTEEVKYWHLADLHNRMYVNLKDGKKASMPRYYKLKLYTDEQRHAINTYQARQAEERLNQAIAEGGEDYFRNQAESVQHQFDRMIHKAQQRQTL